MRVASYTIDELDEAIAAIAGPNAIRRGDWSWSRTTACLGAAAVAFTRARPEDRYSEILRGALQDLDKTGHFNPRDGRWPDD